MTPADKDKPPRQGHGGHLASSEMPPESCLEHTLALCFLARQLPGPTDRFGLLACFLDGRLLEMLLELHFAEDALALQLFLQGPKGLVDVVVAYAYLHVVFTTFLG